MQQALNIILTSWLVGLLIAALAGKTKEYLVWTGNTASSPFRLFWSHYGSYLLTLVLGIAIGVAYGPAIRAFFASLGH